MARVVTAIRKWWFLRWQVAKVERQLTMARAEAEIRMLRRANQEA